MSRIYDDKPLQSVPVENHQWQGKWIATQNEGRGVVLQGKVVGRSKHIITDSSQTRHRYFVVHVKAKFILRRKFNSNGEEIEPNFDLTHKVNTGYLMSSYKVEAKGETDKLSFAQTAQLINKPDLTKFTSKHCPGEALSYWIEEQELAPLEIFENDNVQIKTKGNGPFIFSISKFEADTNTISNAAGEEKQVGESWTDKIMGMKSQGMPGASSSNDDNQGAEEDEWDD